VSKEESVVVRCGSSHGNEEGSCVGNKERSSAKCVGVTRIVSLVPVGAEVEPV
jgi:hypothetical protein